MRIVSRVVSLVLSLLPKPKTADELNAQIRDQLRDPILNVLRKRVTDPILRDHPADCPYGIAATLRVDIKKVDMVCAVLEKDGLIRRSDRQTVAPDKDGETPHLFVQYELPEVSA